MYEYRVRVSVLPNGIEIVYRNNLAGWVSDIEIFQQMQEYHAESLQKTEKEKTIVKIEEMVEGC